jgi:signal transduction histidine kinase
MIPNQRHRHILLGIALISLILSMVSTASGADPITLTGSVGRIPVAGQMSVLKDVTGALTIEDVISYPRAAQFKPVPGDHLSGFAQQGAVWLRFTVLRPADSPRFWLLEVNPAYHEQLQLYSPSPSSGFERQSGGALQPFSQRSIPYRLDLFQLHPPADQPWTIYLRIASKRTILSNLIFWQPESLTKHTLIESIGHGAYFGILLLIFCQNILYWFRLDKRLYLFYSAYVLAAAVIFLDFNGYIHQFLITERTWLLSPLVRLNLILLMVSNLGVLSYLVNLKEHYPRIHKLYSSFFLGAATIFILLILCGQSDRIVIPVLNMLLASVLVSAGITLYMAFRKIPGARLYLTAFGMLLFTGSAKIFVFFDFAPEILPADLFWLSSLLHILIMNLAVTNQVSRYRQEKLKAEAELFAERKILGQQREFLQMISHELRTPLAIIDSTAQILPLVSGDQTTFAHKTKAILTATHRMKLLLDSCLTNERIRDDKIVPVIQSIPFRTLVENSVEQIQKATERHTVQVAAETLPEKLNCDPLLLEILIGNLLDNALKYSPDGGTIQLRGRLCERYGLFLEIEDQGVGIPPEHISMIFDQFYRCGHVAGVRGTGLGLHLVQKIARLHGGDVSCTSQPGVGSTFIVRLPVVPA